MFDGERYIFDYFNLVSFKQIKNSINHSVSALIYLGSNKTLTPLEINNLDRMALSKKFIISNEYGIKNRLNSCLERDYDEYELENDIALYIDLKLPYFYWCWQHKIENNHKVYSSFRRNYPGIEKLEGLEFFYNINYQNEIEYLDNIE